MKNCRSIALLNIQELNAFNGFSRMDFLLLGYDR